MDIIQSTIIGYLTEPQNLICVGAIILFINAKSFVRSIILFYTGGVLLGIFASVLLLGFFIQKLIPRAIKFPFFFGGWPFTAYIYYMTWQNLGIIFQEYQFYAGIYLCFFTLLSLAICYRMGPPVDERSLNLIEWSLQFVSLTLIYFFLQNRQIAITIDVLLILLLLWRKCSKGIQRTCKSIFNYFRNFIYGPEPRRLLSEQEYFEESRIYTRMELERLRQFCQSQDSKKNWRLISRLHTPNRNLYFPCSICRMASFITGDTDHVSALEISAHSEFYDSENDGDSEENSEPDDYLTDDD